MLRTSHVLEKSGSSIATQDVDRNSYSHSDCSHIFCVNRETHFTSRSVSNKFEDIQWTVLLLCQQGLVYHIWLREKRYASRSNIGLLATGCPV